MSSEFFIQPVGCAEEVESVCQNLQSQQAGFDVSKIVDVFAAWGAALNDPSLAHIPGLPFLKLWLRKGTLQSILRREFGEGAETGSWASIGRSRFKAFPVGIVGHWPAGNIEIQPVLSLACSLLGGNKALVRVPERCLEATRSLMGKLLESDPQALLAGRIALLSFDHSLLPVHEAMARSVDGAMIWGGQKAVLEIRALPFPHWAKLAVFGPRISVAVLDKGAWTDPEKCKTWCQRLARDVWQFDQQACSSPQILFIEKDAHTSLEVLVEHLSQAFDHENRLHPRTDITPSLTSSILKKRATWLLENEAHGARFPLSPDWTILSGSGLEMPDPVQGKTLFVLEVANLLEAVARLDGNVQTLGLGMTDSAHEEEIAERAASNGVDRVTKLGQMHTFASPWDGKDLVRSMVRIVQHTPATE